MSFWVSQARNIAINADNSLVKTYAGSTGFDAGYSSENKLAAHRDGWVEFVCEAFNANNRFAIGMDFNFFVWLSVIKY